ncbi:hypothetical protein [Xanthomonas maliensis]|uniref:hypothetical protein n=1 Tax=Xanthomonas maliensis TaxID=1321368 RepID=UPI00126551A6|nr:hypothetical protein [Xanthomonas maliensis]KAB7772576.1 hypothetical protein CKY51_00040 [Xanthomonas maliensis]
MNRNIKLGRVRAIVPTALLAVAMAASSSANAADPAMATRITSNVLKAMAVLVQGNGLSQCVMVLYERPVLGPTLRLNTSQNYQLYAMSTTNCQPGTGLAGLRGSIGFQGSNSGTLDITLNNSGFSYR